MTKNSIMTALRAVPIAMVLGCSLPANAEVTTQTLTITGTVYSSTACTINGNAPINVSFGDVEIEKIGGDYKKIRIDYLLDCKAAIKNEVRMKITGTPWIYGRDYLALLRNNALGIAFFKDGAALNLDTWGNFNRNNKPVLEAVLRRDTREDVLPGPFSTSATLVVEYQ